MSGSDSHSAKRPLYAVLVFGYTEQTLGRPGDPVDTVRDRPTAPVVPGPAEENREAPAATASASRSCKRKAMRKKRRSLTVPPETTPAVPEAETMQELIEKAKKRRTEVIAEAQTIPVVARPPLPPSPQPSGQGYDQVRYNNFSSYIIINFSFTMLAFPDILPL